MGENPYRALHDAFSETLSSRGLSSQLLFNLIARKFLESHVRLKKEERKALRETCERIAAGESAEILASLRFDRKRRKTIDLTPKDGEFERLLEGLEGATTAAALHTVSEQVRRYLSVFTQWSEGGARATDAGVASFRDRCAREWKVPFARLSALIFACTQLGEEFMDELAIAAGKETKLPPKLAALFLLHARACLVSREVEALLHAGFADGALARWRTLHEISVTAAFISDHEELIAERYLAHEPIENGKAAQVYQRHVGKLGLEPFNAETLADMARDSALLGHQYGPAFLEEYGWAAPAFDGRSPRFSHIEERVSLDHFRPYFKMASQQTHSSMKGTLYRLGLADLGSNGEDLFVVGPTNTGYTDPAQLTSLSLCQVTTCLLSQETVLDRLVLMRVLMELQALVPAAFMKVQDRIRKRELKIRARELGAKANATT